MSTILAYLCLTEHWDMPNNTCCTISSDLVSNNCWFGRIYTGLLLYNRWSIVPSIPECPGANDETTRLECMDTSNSISTPGGIFPSNASIIVCSTSIVDWLFVNRHPEIICPLWLRASRVPWRGTELSPGPLKSTKSRMNGLFSPAFFFRFSCLRADCEGRWPGKYCLTEYGLYRLVGRSHGEFIVASGRFGTLEWFVVLSWPVVLLKVRRTSDSTATWSPTGSGDIAFESSSNLENSCIGLIYCGHQYLAVVDYHSVRCWTYLNIWIF